MWERLHQALLERLGEYDQIDWLRASLDSASIAAPSPTDRGKPGSKRHLLVDGVESFSW